MRAAHRLLSALATTVARFFGGFGTCAKPVDTTGCTTTMCCAIPDDTTTDGG